MSRIKSRETVQRIKTFESGVIAGDRMKNALIRTKNAAESISNDDKRKSPSRYAEDKAQYASEDATRIAARFAVIQGRKLAHKGREALREREKAAAKTAAETQEEPARHIPSPYRENTSTQQRRNNGLLEAKGKTDRERPDIRERQPHSHRVHPEAKPPRRASGVVQEERSVERARRYTQRKAQHHRAEAHKRPKELVRTVGRAITSDETGQMENTPLERGRHLAQERAWKKAVEAQRGQLSGVSANAVADAREHTPYLTIPGDSQLAFQPRQAEITAKKFPQKLSGHIRKAQWEDRTSRSASKLGVKLRSEALKSGENGVKTAEQTSKATIKTAQASASAAQKSAKTAAKATAQATRAAAETASASAKLASKATGSAARAIGEAAKELLAALAAGGWVAGIAIIVILLIGLVAASPFGIFFAGDNRSNDAVPVSVAVSQVNFDFNSQLMSLQSGDYSDITIAGEMADWPEVLAVFAVKVAGSEDVDAMDVATMDPTRIAKLKSVFWDMNVLTSTVEVINHPDSNPDDAVDDSWTERILHISITAKTAEDMKTEYHFTDKQKAVLDELLSNRDMLLDLIGDLMFMSPDAEELIRNLPADLSEERKAVVKTACSLVGKVNYFWGGKSLVIGWDPRWGTIQKVWAEGNSTTGTYRPYGLDCSGFVDWVFYNVSNGAYVIGHGGGATMQHTYCTAITWDEAIPGDLVFYPGDSHVGIVGGRDENGNLLIIHCASSANGTVITNTDGFIAVGRPLFY